MLGEYRAVLLRKHRIEDRLEIRDVVDNRLISVQSDRFLPVILNIESLVGGGSKRRSTENSRWRLGGENGFSCSDRGIAGGPAGQFLGVHAAGGDDAACRRA